MTRQLFLPTCQVFFKNIHSIGGKERDVPLNLHRVQRKSLCKQLIQKKMKMMQTLLKNQRESCNMRKGGMSAYCNHFCFQVFICMPLLDTVTVSPDTNAVLSLKETGWADSSQQVPACQSIGRQEVALAQTPKHTLHPLHTPKFVTLASAAAEATLPPASLDPFLTPLSPFPKCGSKLFNCKTTRHCSR